MCRVCAFVWGNPGDLSWREFQLPRFNIAGYEWLKLHEADHGCIPKAYPSKRNKSAVLEHSSNTANTVNTGMNRAKQHRRNTIKHEDKE